MKKHSLKAPQSVSQAAFYNILGSITLNGINFLTLPIFTKLLGPASYGTVSIYTAWVAIGTIFIGLQAHGVINNVVVLLPKEEHNKCFSSLLGMATFSGIIIFALIAILIKPVSSFLGMNPLLIYMLLLHSFGTFCINFASAKMIACKMAKQNFYLSFSSTIFSILLSLILVWLIPQHNEKYFGRIMGYAVPAVLIGVFFYLHYILQGRQFVSLKYWGFSLPLCLPLIFHGLSHTILGQSDKFMLQRYMTDTAVGIYSFIVTLTHLLNVIWNALNNTWVPYYFDDLKNNRFNEIRIKSRNYISLYTTLTAGFILISPELVRIMVSKDFWEGIPLIPVMSLGMYFIFLYSFAVNFQFYHRKTLTIALGTSGAAFANILFNSFLIPLLGMYGAALATAAAYFLLFVFHEAISRFLFRDSYHCLTKQYIMAGLIILGATLLFDIFSSVWIVRWVIGGMLGVLELWKIIRRHTIF